MRITELRGENFKRIIAVRIRPDRNVVTIGGENGAGKTSVLDGIAVALGGKDLCPDEPLRKGADNGFVEVALDDGLVVKRTFTERGTALEVKSADGAKYGSPQAMLDKLVSTLTFDPLAFARSKPAEQVATLRQLAGVDTTKLDDHRQGLYEQRTEVGREAKRLTGALEKMPEVEDVQPVDVGELAAELQRRRDLNNAKAAKARKLDAVKAEGKKLVSECDSLEARIAQLQEQIAEKRAQVAALRAEVEATPDAIEMEVVERLKAAESINAKARAAAERHKLAGELAAAIDKSEALTKQIADIDDAKAKLLEEAKIPVHGLTFDESGVCLDGVPFSQSSAAQQIRASATIGLALNPQLRVLLIRDGSLLDAKSLAALEEIATQRDAQIWLERVGDVGATVVIEDGEIRGDGKTREQREKEFRARNRDREPGADG